MEALGIPQPRGRGRYRHRGRASRAAARIGYPVLVRPSYVLGGRAMQIVSERGAPAPLPANRRGDQRGPAGAGRPATSWARSWRWTPSATARRSSSPASWSMVERTGIHSGDSISVYPTFSREPEGQGHDHRLHRSSLGLRHRHRRPVQHPVHRRRAGRRLRHRGQPALLAHRALPLQVHAACRWPTSPRRCILGKTPPASRASPSVYGRRRSAGTSRRPAFSFAKIRGMDAYLSPGDEVHRRGHRLRRQADPRALQGAAGLGHARLELRHDLRHHRRPRQGAGAAARAAGSTTWASTSRPPPAPPSSCRAHGIRTRTRPQDQRGQRRDSSSRMRQGHVSYVINTIDINQHDTRLRRLRNPPLRPWRTT